MIRKIAIGATVLLSLVLNSLNLPAISAAFHKERVKIGSASYTLLTIELEKQDKITFVSPHRFDLRGSNMVEWFGKSFKGKAAINGGFFKRDSQLPVGILYKDESLLCGPIFKRTALIGFKNGTFKIESLSFKGWIKSGFLSIDVQNYNQPRLSKSEVIVYDQKWSSVIPSIFKGGRLLLVRDGKIIGESTQKVKVPVDGYVIYGPQEKLKDLKVGDSVSFSYTIPEVNLNDVDFILGAGPKLLEKGQVVNRISTERFSCASICHSARRSGVGIRNGKLYFVVIPQAVSISTFSQILQEAGFDEGMNLDGGSSTQLFYKGKTILYGAPVNNSLIIF